MEILAIFDGRDLDLAEVIVNLCLDVQAANLTKLDVLGVKVVVFEVKNLKFHVNLIEFGLKKAKIKKLLPSDLFWFFSEKTSVTRRV